MKKLIMKFSGLLAIVTIMFYNIQMPKIVDDSGITLSYMQNIAQAQDESGAGRPCIVCLCEVCYLESDGWFVMGILVG